MLCQLSYTPTVFDAMMITERDHFVKTWKAPFLRMMAAYYECAQANLDFWST